MRDAALNRAIDELAARLGARAATLQLGTAAPLDLGGFTLVPRATAPNDVDTSRALLLVAAIGAVSLPIAGYWAMGPQDVEDVGRQAPAATVAPMPKSALPPAASYSPPPAPVETVAPAREAPSASEPRHASGKEGVTGNRHLARGALGATRLLNLRELRRIRAIMRDRSARARAWPEFRGDRASSEDSAITRRLNLREGRRWGRHRGDDR